MAFLINMDCPCCRDGLWHCRKCWDRFHNKGLKGANDYESPDHYGQKMFSREMINGAKQSLQMEIQFESKIKEDKKRKYKEGCYSH